MNLNNIITTILVVLTSCSCVQNREILNVDNCTINSFNETVKISPSPVGPNPYTKDFIYAKINDRICNVHKDEENLIRQFKTYFSALLLGDIEACKKYVFKDAVDYEKKKFPGLTEQDILDRCFSRTAMRDIDNLTELAYKMGWEIVPCVPIFFDKVSFKNEIFVTFGLAIYIDAKKFCLTPKKIEKCIAYSANAGKNWAFMSLNAESKDVLKLSCDDEIIDILTKPSNLVIQESPSF